MLILRHIVPIWHHLVYFVTRCKVIASLSYLPFHIVPIVSLFLEDFQVRIPQFGLGLGFQSGLVNVEDIFDYEPIDREDGYFLSG
jgi:hypothetical protein